jgi:hypothetical protein
MKDSLETREERKQRTYPSENTGAEASLNITTFFGSIEKPAIGKIIRQPRNRMPAGGSR